MDKPSPARGLTSLREAQERINQLEREAEGLEEPQHVHDPKDVHHATPLFGPRGLAPDSRKGTIANETLIR